MNLWLRRHSLRLRPYAPAILIVSFGLAVSSLLGAILYALIFQPLPGVLQPEELVYVYTQSKTGPVAAVPPAMLEETRARADALAEFSSHWPISLSSTQYGEGGQVRGEAVERNYFQLLGVRLQAGSAFHHADAVGVTGGVVIGDALWTRLWGRNAEALGSALRLNNRLYTVIGIASARFRGLTDPWSPSEFWILFEDWRPDHRDFGKGAFARLRPGAVSAQLQNTIAIGTGTPGASPPRYLVLPIRSLSSRMDPTGSVTPRSLGYGLGVLTALVIVVVAVNASFLLRAIAVVRATESAVRIALGATFWQVARAPAAEVATAMIGAGAVAVILAAVLFTVFQYYTPERLFVPVVVDFRLVAAFVAQLLLVTLWITIAPLTVIWRTDVMATLARDPRSVSMVGRGNRLLNAASVQLVLSAAILVIAASSLTALLQSENRRPGYDTTGIITVALFLPPSGSLHTEQRVSEYRSRTKRFYNEVLSRLRRNVDVHEVALARRLPIRNAATATPVVAASGAEMAYVFSQDAVIHEVSPGYFGVFGIRIEQGRPLTDADTATSQRVVVITRSLAQRFWPSGSAVGNYLRLSSGQTEYLIVGVTSDVLPLIEGRLGRHAAFTSMGQNDLPVPYYAVIRSRGGIRQGLARSVWRDMKESDAGVTILRTAALSELSAEVLYPRRVAAAMVVVAGVCALALAGFGVFAQLSLSVEASRREIGVRSALGATGADIAKLVGRRALRLAMKAVALGIPLGALAVALIGRYIVAVPRPGVVSTTFVVLSVGCTATLASLRPAKSAVETDPIKAMRDYG